jgi:hypothetical protein
VSGPWPEGDPRWDDDRATVRFGPPPTRVVLARPAPTRVWWRRPGLGLLAGIVGVVLVVAAVGSLGGDDRPAVRPTPCTGRAPGSPITAAGPGVQRLTVRVDGCPREATYDRATAILEVAGTPGYRIGAPDDRLLVGDWDCDGAPTPALYRPATGVVYAFDRWATDDAVPSAAPRATGILDGIPRVDGSRGCDEVVVEPDRSRAPAEAPH